MNVNYFKCGNCGKIFSNWDWDNDMSFCDCRNKFCSSCADLIKRNKKELDKRSVNMNMNINEVLKNIQELTVSSNFWNDIIEAFEDYTFEGEKRVIVNKTSDNEYQAYVDKRNSPIIKIKVNGNKVVDAWI